VSRNEQKREGKKGTVSSANLKVGKNLRWVGGSPRDGKRNIQRITPIASGQQSRITTGLNKKPAGPHHSLLPNLVFTRDRKTSQSNARKRGGGAKNGSFNFAVLRSGKKSQKQHLVTGITKGYQRRQFFHDVREKKKKKR